MKKITVLTIIALCSSPVFAKQHGEQGGFAGPSTQSGFSGPSIGAISVEQAKALQDDAPVALQGSIEKNLGGESYLFRDDSGTINIDVDHKHWAGQTITPQDKIELQGKIDKNRNGEVEIDVKRITKLP